MKRFSTKKIISIVSLSIMCGTAAQANPAFARQVGMDCASCHIQQMPKLNAFGREFKISGFTMTGGQQGLQSDQGAGLSLPENFGVSMAVKARFIESNNGSGADESQSQIFDESVLLLGGKISEFAGGSFEIGPGAATLVHELDANGNPTGNFDEIGGAGLGLSGKLTLSKAFDFGRLGVTIYNTDALGAFAGQEGYSTGLFRPTRAFENRSKANILQKNGIGAGSATGAQAFYHGNGLYATFGQYLPGFGVSMNVETEGYKDFARIAYEFGLSGYNIAFGGFYKGGDVINPAAQATISGSDIWSVDADDLDRKANGLDMQIEGSVSDMSLMVTGALLLKNEYSAGGRIGATKMEDTGFSFDAQLYPVDYLGVKVAYLSSESKDTTVGGLTDDQSIVSLGVDYLAAQNVRFTIEYSYTDYSGSANTNVGSDGDLLFMTMVSF